MSERGHTRRDALRLALLGGGGTLLGGGALLAAGCGDDRGTLAGPHTDAVLRTSIAIDYASYYAPATDIIALAKRRAAQRGLALTFSADPAGAGAQAASLKRLTGERGGFRVVVVAPFDAAAIQGALQDARGRGIEVVSFVSPLRDASAAIAVDAQDAARRLAAHAAAHGVRSATLIAPPATSPVPDPFFGHAQRAARALPAALRAVGIAIDRTVTALGTPDATAALRAATATGVRPRAVLAWNDATALGAAAAVPRSGYVGGLGAPAVSTAAALRALQDDGGPLRVLVAARVAALAQALVDVPAALLGGTRPPAAATRVPVTTFTPGSAATRAALADYA